MLLLLSSVVAVLFAITIALAERAIVKSGNRSSYESCLLWAWRLLGVACIFSTVLLGIDQDYSALISAIGYIFIMVFPLNIVLIAGWIRQEIRFYKFKKQNVSA